MHNNKKRIFLIGQLQASSTFYETNTAGLSNEEATKKAHNDINEEAIVKAELILHSVNGTKFNLILTEFAHEWISAHDDV
ncbi:hypothetical protein BC351_00700 [Paenibacillus ferrarius]|uniref:Uncharacterized protein n=1 Tax=Paenibacillus ferrarius TaxID=1469647 RepID=A0A1V4HSI7_9BACL|nr:hypothetical protein [Paenibacillus ferrarius]OPH61792.1 hypothetical protein BC351_00700 [Paenibacillus ferrarius]